MRALSLNVDTSFKFVWGSFWSPNKMEKQILTDEIQDPEFLDFTVEHIIELFGYLATGRVNIRICRDITGEMWFGVG